MLLRDCDWSENWSTRVAHISHLLAHLQARDVTLEFFKACSRPCLDQRSALSFKRDPHSGLVELTNEECCDSHSLEHALLLGDSFTLTYLKRRLSREEV